LSSGNYDWLQCQLNDPFGWNEWNCTCGNTPVVFDLQGDNFDFTNLANGVLFDINNDGAKEQLSWTTANSGDAWLALDRNGNGFIDNGRELFGNYTPQPPSAFGNGYIALAEFDKPEKGGNADGKMDANDQVFASLLLWQDFNHNGISENTELQRLSASNIGAISLNYKLSKRVDAHGNQFRYRSKLSPNAGGPNITRWSFDVNLLRAR
jgi:hypothetical protein